MNTPCEPASAKIQREYIRDRSPKENVNATTTLIQNKISVNIIIGSPHLGTATYANITTIHERPIEKDELSSITVTTDIR